MLSITSTMSALPNQSVPAKGVAGWHGQRWRCRKLNTPKRRKHQPLKLLTMGCGLPRCTWSRRGVWKNWPQAKACETIKEADGRTKLPASHRKQLDGMESDDEGSLPHAKR